MAHQTEEKLLLWRERVRSLLLFFQHKVQYGNLRAQYHDWSGQDGHSTHLCLVYELPGGSTNQVTVTYHHNDGYFAYLCPDGHSERVTDDLEEVLAMLDSTIRRIPERRRERLLEQVERWFGEGRTSHEMFLEINKLLQMDFKGGSITHHELKEGIYHILRLGKQGSG